MPSSLSLGRIRLICALVAGAALSALVVADSTRADGFDPLTDGFNQSYLGSVSTSDPYTVPQRDTLSNFGPDPRTHRYGDRFESPNVLSDEKNFGPDADRPRTKPLFNFTF